MKITAGDYMVGLLLALARYVPGALYFLSRPELSKATHGSGKAALEI